MKTVYKLLLLLLIIGSSACACMPTINVTEKKEKAINFQEIRKSIATINVRVTGTASVADGSVTVIDRWFRGTGFIISQQKDFTLIATAEHVCMPSVEDIDPKIKQILDLQILHAINSYSGVRNFGLVTFSEEKLDLCLLMISKNNLPAVSLLDRGQEYGEKTYFLGFSQAMGVNTDVIPIFNARFIGSEITSFGLPYTVFSGPILGPGISGGIALDQNGQVTSLIHRVRDTYTIGSGSEFLKIALSENLRIINENLPEWKSALEVVVEEEKKFNIQTSSTSSLNP